MTEDRRSKKAIRARMAQTGEKYTQARRALGIAEGQAVGAERTDGSRTFAEECLADLGAHQLQRRDLKAAAVAAVSRLPEELREVQMLRTLALPVMPVLIRLSASGFPGVDLKTDASWAASVAVRRRDLHILAEGGADRELLGPHCDLLTLVESRIGQWPDTEWKAAVRACVERLVEAQDDGRRRGQQNRMTRAPAVETQLTTDGWILRHPADHYFVKARRSISDPALDAYLDDQITAMSTSYRALADRSSIPPSDVIVELQISGPVPNGWKEPVPATITEVRHGRLTAGSQIGLRLVADPEAPFNGTLLSIHEGERWLTCGTLFEDGTLLPQDGTRRLPQR